MELLVPASVHDEHTELRAELQRAIDAGGRITPAARAVAEVLDPHVAREEALALPLLSLLPALTTGALPPEADAARPLAARLDVEVPALLAEHRVIAGALKALVDAADAEGRPEYVTFVRQWARHARNEEELLYPAARLVGEYITLRSQAPAYACLG